MTNGSTGSNERLDRIEASISALVQHGQQVDERIDRLATAIQDDRVQRREEYNELRNAIADTNQTVASTNQRLDAFIQETRTWRTQYEQHKVETDQRFNILLEEARADREEFRNAIERLSGN